MIPREDDFDTHEEWITVIRVYAARRVAIAWCLVLGILMFVLLVRLVPRHEVQVVRDSRYSHVVIHDRWTGDRDHTVRR
ncbi:MAG: hypothetical protein OXG72_16045 [Acidobacteria bacterium]|nr:hypothetical protein [Acidobacteriota bacterium]